MGIVTGDYDRDGDLDYYLANLGVNAQLQREPFGYLDVAAERGVTSGKDACHDDLLLTSWSVAFHDFDRDGWLDLWVAHGHIPSAPEIANSNERSTLLFRQDGETQSFAEVAPWLGVQRPAWLGRGTAFADWDHDGDLDVAQFFVGEPTTLLRNDSPGSPGWLALRLQGVSSNRDGLGARVWVEGGGVTWVREVARQYGYGASSTPWVHVGLGQLSAVDEVRVRWPSGAIQRRHDLAMGARHLVLEPRGVLAAVVVPPGGVAEGEPLVVEVSAASSAGVASGSARVQLLRPDGTVAAEASAAMPAITPGGSASASVALDVPSGLVSDPGAELRLLTTFDDSGGGLDQRLDYVMVIP